MADIAASSSLSTPPELTRLAGAALRMYATGQVPPAADDLAFAAIMNERRTDQEITSSVCSRDCSSGHGERCPGLRRRLRGCRWILDQAAVL